MTESPFQVKFWIMPRTGTVSAPVDSAAAGVTATKGFDLARDLIGGAMVGTSGQARAEYVATAVRDLQSFDVALWDNRRPARRLASHGRCRDRVLTVDYQRPSRQGRAMAR